MKTKAGLLAILLLAVLLSACATLTSAISPPGAGNIAKLAVVSALGDHLQGIQVGSTAFGTTHYTQPVTAWKVDEFAAYYAASVLSDAGLQASTLQLGGLEESDSPWTLSSSLIKPVALAAAQQGYDTVLLIHKANSGDFPGYPAGYGLYQRRFFGQVQQCVYALYIVSLIDTKTQRETGWEWGGSDPCAEQSSQFSTQLRFADYTPQDQLRIKTLLEAHLKTGIQDAISKLGLSKPR